MMGNNAKRQRRRDSNPRHVAKSGLITVRNGGVQEYIELLPIFDYVRASL